MNDYHCWFIVTVIVIVVVVIIDIAVIVNVITKKIIING